MALLVVTLDGSPNAERALPHACARMRPGDRMLLARIVELPVTGTTLDWIQASVRNAEAYLDRLAAELPGEASTVVKVGSPRTEILQLLTEHRPDLLVMAANGRHPVGDCLLGSVAAQVLRRSPCPVWLVPGRADWRLPVTRVMVALDTSAQSETGLDFVTAWVPGSAHLILMAATDLDQEVWTTVPGGAECQRRALSALHRYLAELAEPLRAAGWSVETVVEDGSAPCCIPEVARCLGVDLLIMATHGRTGFARWALGSVAEHVLHRAPCPLVLVNLQTAAPVATLDLAAGHS